MGKKKLGKNRLDQYYHLAKGQGYRARSAYKLIQLDQKYNFLSTTKSVIDLCAAPGGWLQVCTNHNMDFILGVDLERIKTIPGVETIVGDITSAVTKQTIRSKAQKVDLVLNDGAPNVGTSWEKDAFMQNELSLHAFKLAAEFLNENGVFITKLFRSKDYFSLLSVFNKVFERVEATKPLSSREESAEIFVCCFGFKPENVMEEYFNANVIFGECGEVEEFDRIKVLDFKDFLLSENPMKEIGMYAKIKCDVQHELIDEEVKSLFSDLKVIGKTDVKRLLRMRKKVLKLIQGNELCVEGVNFIEVADEGNLIKPMTDEEKINEMEKKMRKAEKKKIKKENKDNLKVEVCGNNENFIEEKRKRRKGKQLNVEEEERALFKRNNFFDDKIFEGVETKIDKTEGKYEEMESCSDDIELDEKELELALKMKIDEEKFIEDTINRHCCDKSMVPDFIKEEEKEFEGRGIKNKKELEARGRRRNRANKITKNIIERKKDDDSEEEADLQKRVSKSVFRKSRSKPRIAFSSKGRSNVPKGKGRLKFVDKRMKKDKRIIKK